jgi:hypothetical protein
MTTLLASIRPPILVHNSQVMACVYIPVCTVYSFFSFLLPPIGIMYIWAVSFFFYRDQRNDDSTQLFRNVLLSFSNVIRWKVTTDRGGPNWRREKETRPLWLRGENSILLVNNKTIRWTWVILLFTENRVPVLPRYFIFLFFISQ